MATIKNQLRKQALDKSKRQIELLMDFGEELQNLVLEHQTRGLDSFFIIAVLGHVKHLVRRLAIDRVEESLEIEQMIGYKEAS